jgi:iron complex outermembrane recepter protein
MKDTTRLQLAIRLALAACATTAVAPSLVNAQTQAVESSAADSNKKSSAALEGTAEPALQEVVVTGSRIAVAPNDISMSPVMTVTQVDIQQSGYLRVEDVLNSLPSITAEQGSGDSISSTGIATVSLRDLGSNRTLVLVDGRRLQPGGSGGVPPGTANAADINQIPQALLKSVDVLTGGASSVYGADAVAGVVNFILDTHFTGVKIDSNYSFYQHSNSSAASAQYDGYLSNFGAAAPSGTANVGQSKDVSIIVGSNFADDKGNATAYFTYLNTQPVAGYQIDHAGCSLDGSANSKAPAPSCGGSPIGPNGYIFGYGEVGGATTELLGPQAVDPKTGLLRPANSTTDLYNFGALSYLQRQSERYTAGGFTHYDVNDYVSVYTETMFARNSSQAQYGPSGDFGTNVHPISCTNPLLSAQEVSVICNPTFLAANQALYNAPGSASFNPSLSNSAFLYTYRRNIEGGGRQDNYTSTSIRQVIGTNGKINDAWKYDAYVQVGITQLSDIESNFLNSDLIVNALNVVGTPAAPVCATGGSCVPWNIWTPGGVTPAALAYLESPATYSAVSTEYVADGSVTGDLGKYGVQLPTASSGLQVNVGTEFREEKFVFKPDYIYGAGLNSGGGNGAAPFNGSVHVWEGFTEVHLPIVDNLPGAYNVSFDGGYRYSAYTLGGNTNTYKFQVEYAPIQDVRFRGGYNRAVRAPNLGELFQPAEVGSGGAPDPCWGTAPSLSLAQCERTGVTAGEYGKMPANPAAQSNTLQGGSTTLLPEIADTYTFGVVWHPSFLSNFVFSVDAFNIKIRNAIEELSSTTIIDACANLGSLCGLIHRGLGGSLWNSPADYVSATEQNVGSILTRGADLSSHYLQDIGPGGKLSFNLTGTYTKDFNTVPLPGETAYNCTGYAGNTCGPPQPHFRSVLSTTWLAPWYGADLTLRWRFIGPTQMEGVSQNPQLAASGYYQGYNIPGYNYLDLSASAQVTSFLDVRVGVNNITDKDPPVVLGGTFGCNANNCNDNTWLGTYDALGRYLYAHVTLKF